MRIFENHTIQRGRLHVRVGLELNVVAVFARTRDLPRMPAFWRTRLQGSRTVISRTMLSGWRVLILSGLIASACCQPLLGQDPFGGGADPFGGPRRPPAVGGNPLAGPAPQAALETDPVVLAIRESNPQTAGERVRAVQAMLDYGRPDEAQRYLQSIVGGMPDVNQLAALARRFGSALFMRLARDTDVQPQGKQLADAVLKAAQQVARDPRRLRGLVRQLNADSVEQRQAALNDLRVAGYPAVNPLLAALADPRRAGEHRRIRAALVELGSAYAGPLTAALEVNQPAFQAQVIDVLGRIGSRKAIAYLVRPAVAANTDPALRDAARRALQRLVGSVPSAWDAEAFLLRRTKDLLSPTDSPENAGTREVWAWDPQQGGAVSRLVGSGQAAAATAARFAAELYALVPDNSEYRRLALVTSLESAKRLEGFDRPLRRDPGTAYAKAVALGTAATEDALAFAIDRRYLGAAIGAAEVLGDSGETALLHTDGRSESALTRALRHRNRRVRYAAAMAILRLDPKSPYAGSSFLSETLGWLAATTGERRALIVHPRSERTQSLVGLLAEIGYEADSAQTGHRAIIIAARESDLEFVLISPLVDGPSYQELVQRLRRNRPTATLPVGILARPDQLQDARRFADHDPLTRAFPRPHDAATISYEAAELLALSPVDHVPLDERQAQALAAIDGLLKLAEQPEYYGFYDLIRQEANIASALNHAPLGKRAAALLGILATPSAQRLLADVASQPGRSLALRKAAASAFRHAVEQRRLLLTTHEILAQYDRYNQSATLDADTQNVLASLLDTIELRAKPTSQPGGGANSSGSGDSSGGQTDP